MKTQSKSVSDTQKRVPETTSAYYEILANVPEKKKTETRGAKPGKTFHAKATRFTSFILVTTIINLALLSYVSYQIYTAVTS